MTKAVIKTMQNFINPRNGEILMENMAFAHEIDVVPGGIDWMNADDHTVLVCCQIAMVTKVKELIAEGATFLKLQECPDWVLKGKIISRALEDQG